MNYKPGDHYYALFTTQGSTGAATNADSAPTATANHNGSDDGSFTLTVTNLDTGRYKIAGTIPSGYASGDVVNISVAATVGGVAGKSIVDAFILDAKRLSDLNDAAAAPTATVIRQEIDAHSTMLSGLASGVTALGSPMQAGASVVLTDGSLTSAKFASGATIPRCTLVDTVTTYTGNTPQTGDAFARLGAPSGASLAADLAAAKSDTNTLTTRIGSQLTITSGMVDVHDRTGFKLASDGLDTISTAAPSGVAGNFREMLVQTWRRFFKKAVKASNQIKTYADDNSTVLTTQSATDDGVTQTQGTAS